MFIETLVIAALVVAALFNVQPTDTGIRLGSGGTVRELPSAQDKWVEAFRSTQIVYYANIGRLRKTGRERAQMWRMTDYKISQINGELIYTSKKTLEEYDCDIGRVRLLYTALYDGHMGQGETLYTHSEAYAWEDVQLDTSMAAMWKIACAQK